MRSFVTGLYVYLVVLFGYKWREEELGEISGEEKAVQFVAGHFLEIVVGWENGVSLVLFIPHLGLN